MSAMFRLGAISLFLLPMAARADVAGCACDPADSASLEARECGLTREALKQPEAPAVFFLKDINPRKPNRWLALPRQVTKGVYRLPEMTAKERAALWTAAIARAKELWGEGWGLAMNGDLVRTQCQMHVHLGKFVEGAESDNFVVIRSVEEIPAPDGEGLWVHPTRDGKMHVHTGEILTETILVR
jgi:diadenosine tetraphosphate (Ap4A) HIT family hydrolase